MSRHGRHRQGLDVYHPSRRRRSVAGMMTVAECRLVNPAPRRSSSSRSRQCRRRRRRRPSSSRYRSTIAEDDAPARSSEGEALAHHDVFVSLIFSQHGASPLRVMCILQECVACDYMI
jgi:hypothetical protein